MIALFKRIVVFLLTWEARLVLARHKPQIIAVTGSMGKTTTKDAIFAALVAGGLHARKSEKSFNSEIGVPLTVLGCDNAWNNPILWAWNILRGLVVIAAPSYPKWLVLEVGADRPGDIETTARWLRPDVAVFTGIPDVPVHVEYFDSPRAVVREKKRLAAHLKPGGLVILNGDDANLASLRTEYADACITYGVSSRFEYTALGYEIRYERDTPVGIGFSAVHDRESVRVTLDGAIGYPRVYAGLAALAAAGVAGVPLVRAAEGLAAWEPQPGRLRLLKGIKGSIIIDDTYNSSPAAAFAALDTLGSIRTAGTRIAVLGDMLELGRFSSDSHRELGTRAAQSAGMLVTVGFRSRAAAEAARDAGMRDEQVRQYDQGESAHAGKELEPDIREGDVILIKGSQGMRMERAAEELMAEPERAADLLVRQGKEWERR
jgi:UDP-N-acetylmuramoyl-tripeptide--D-alanyl-D-alanine ligase